ncbi:hypothetical protein GCM10010254_64670 [Streptomyces chromofuscus]|nr:hypothetical protein GCM10010254_64670 [Streptomyces chromofuscus]
MVLRGAGFPASDLTACGSPSLAAAADLAAGGDPTAAADYRHAYDRAVDDLRAGVAASGSTGPRVLRFSPLRCRRGGGRP